MHVTIVHLRVKAQHLEAFKAAARANHEASVREPGNRRFDVLQAADDPTHFVLYEAYDSAQAAAAHRETEHYLRWRETVSDWFAAPREAAQFTALLPSFAGAETG
jgi:(4S)-4-hydroxy-5-phosphonooxypentane-2,3-dione isomerase